MSKKSETEGRWVAGCVAGVLEDGDDEVKGEEEEAEEEVARVDDLGDGVELFEAREEVDDMMGWALFRVCVCDEGGRGISRSWGITEDFIEDSSGCLSRTTAATMKMMMVHKLRSVVSLHQEGPDIRHGLTGHDGQRMANKNACPSEKMSHP